MKLSVYGNVLDMSEVICQCLGISKGVWGALEGVEGLRGMSVFNVLQFSEVTNEILDIFQ